MVCSGHLKPELKMLEETSWKWGGQLGLVDLGDVLLLAATVQPQEPQQATGETSWAFTARALGKVGTFLPGPSPRE